MCKTVLVFLMSFLASFGVFAAGPDYTTLTASVNFSDVITALLAVAASIIAVYIAWKGAKLIIHAVKGA